MQFCAGRSFGLSLQERLTRHSKLNPKTGCIEWTGYKNRNGYGAIRISGEKRENIGAHRAAWIAENGSIPEGMHVLHKCDNRACINPDHLFLGTNTDNVRDMMVKGRNVVLRGESKHNSKLTDDQVRKIRVDTRTHREIADDFKVHNSIISMIKNGKIWRHVI